MVNKIDVANTAIGIVSAGIDQLAQSQEPKRMKARTISTDGPEFCLIETPTRYLGFQGSPGKYRALVRPRVDVLDQPRALAKVDAKEYELPFPFSGMRENVILPFGLVAVVAGTGIGKSEFLRALGRVIKTERVLATEVFDTDEERQTVPMFIGVDAALAFLVTNQLNGSDALPVLDSLREALFEINGPAGQKGIINAFFTALTRASMTLSRSGITMLAAVNPMFDDAEYISLFRRNLISGLGGVIEVKERIDNGSTVTFSGTATFRPNRLARDWSFTAPSAGALQANPPKSSGTDVTFNQYYPDLGVVSITERIALNNINAI